MVIIFFHVTHLVVRALLGPTRESPGLRVEAAGRKGSWGPGAAPGRAQEQGPPHRHPAGLGQPGFV